MHFNCKEVLFTKISTTFFLRKSKWENSFLLKRSQKSSEHSIYTSHHYLGWKSPEKRSRFCMTIDI
jgi:hypothetical protein